MTPFLKLFSKVSVFIGTLERRFSVEDTRKRIKKSAFSNKNALVSKLIKLDVLAHNVLN